MNYKCNAVAGRKDTVILSSALMWHWFHLKISQMGKCKVNMVMQRLITLFRAKRGERTLLNNLLAFSPLLPPAGMMFDFHFLFYILFLFLSFVRGMQQETFFYSEAQKLCFCWWNVPKLSFCSLGALLIDCSKYLYNGVTLLVVHQTKWIKIHRSAICCTRQFYS